MPITITAKDRIANDIDDPGGADLRVAFLQIERYTVQLEQTLGITVGGATSPTSPINLPVGGLAGVTTLPTTTRALTNATNAPLGAGTFQLVGGYRYLLNVYAAGAISVASPAFVNIQLTSATPAPLPAGPPWFVISLNSPAVGATVVGQATALLTMPGRRGTVATETVNVIGSCPGTTPVFTIQANAIQMYVTRVA